MEVKYSKAYFKFCKGPRKRTLIFELNYEGKILIMPQDIQNTILDYYHNLYSKDEMLEINTQARRIFFFSVLKIMTKEQNTFLIQPFIVDDLYIAFKDLSTSKISNFDGIPTEFFKEL